MQRKETCSALKSRLFSMLAKFLLLPVLLVAAGMEVTASAQEKLTVAMLQSPTQTPFWVALESGYFREYGLEVVPVQFTGGTQTIMALMSGEVQMTTTGGPAAVNANLQGGSTVVIGTTLGVFPYTFYVSDKIRRVEDLKGKRIGVGGFGGVQHNAVLFALRKLNFNPDTDVTLVQIALPFSNHLAAMASGSIYGTIFQFPETKKASELGFKPVLNLAQSGVKFPTNQVTTTRSYVKNNRETVKKFMKGFITGLARVKRDRNFTMSVLKKYLRITDPQLLTGTYDYWVELYPPKAYVDPQELETYLRTLKDRGSANPEDFMDNSILSELDREGFIEAAYAKFGKR